MPGARAKTTVAKSADTDALVRSNGNAANDYNVFVDHVLEPLPAEALIDFDYNRIHRAARRDLWFRADTATHFFERFLTYVRAAQAYYDFVEKAGHLKNLADIDTSPIVKEWRAAVARQILTPAPSMAEVRWKRTAAKNPCLPIDKAEIGRAIAADEAFLAGHPVRRRR